MAICEVETFLGIKLGYVYQYTIQKAELGSETSTRFMDGTNLGTVCGDRLLAFGSIRKLKES